ncbi:teichoic acid D-Ala incorporation-associated protein DltX [Kurthia sibirica]|uniref:Teichoic acid D-Ala incorporation-associated protein DltX n=1 Tax=Kurthia sibirica TaxID=202750 RepID=A0A2U3AL73_9BACL|nr:teichoic acid D-Ala incorporation-associated protein DltX [Kurthia sibirica]PWI25249.1 teichoic acid D-Ala incorporation-associated protein DltX [Kurthia sibirica]GEK33750.1 hypothetical protein KSI01_12830 [Kurthia sibirica]
MMKMKENSTLGFISRTLFYFSILVLLVLIYGFHDMNAGPFIYAEF